VIESASTGSQRAHLHVAAGAVPACVGEITDAAAPCAPVPWWLCLRCLRCCCKKKNRGQTRSNSVVSNRSYQDNTGFYKRESVVSVKKRDSTASKKRPSSTIEDVP
jgi:hypothetical protein